MNVYRITLLKWSNSLQGSGYPGRWNSKGRFVIYTSSSRALASLENIVHRSGEGLNGQFKIMVIDIPESVKIKSLELRKLPRDWYKYSNYKRRQIIGDQWVDDSKFCVLKVPSALINMESNYLINPSHRLFKSIKIKTIEEFVFDPRIK